MNVLQRVTKLMCVAAAAIVLCIVPSIAQSAEMALDQPGPFAVGERTVTVVRPDSTTFNALLFYPGTTSGIDVPIDPTGGPYPAISFGHGFLQPPTQYRSTLEHLASWGYLAIATESYQNLFPDHAAYAVDLSLCLTWLEELNSQKQSFLFGMVDVDRFGLSGHSMGGGASMLAAADDPRIKAVANLAAANTNPSAVAAAANLVIPVSLIAGTQDTITPIGSHGELMYDNATVPRQLPLIVGGFHCGFTDNSFIFCDSGSISRAEQLSITRRLLVQFFNLHLKGDQCQWQHVWGPEAMNDPAVAMTLDPRSTLETAQETITGPAGSQVAITMTITNTNDQPTSFGLFAEADACLLDVQPSQSPVIGNGESATFDLAIQMPEQEKAVLLSARSMLDDAARSYATITMQPELLIVGDLNGDGVVNVSDLLILLGVWGPCPQGDDCPADLNGDGVVNVSDLLILLSNWG